MIKEKPIKNKLRNMLHSILNTNDKNNIDKYVNQELSFFPDIIEIHVMIESITLLLGLYDKYTAEHSLRVAALAEKISRLFDRSELDHRKIRIAAHLHDIGKIAISPDILNKKERLTNDEFQRIKRHPVFGHEIICRIDQLSSISRTILHHHERYDGTGYPHRLKGEEIPLDSRIITLADSFDAMVTSRPYKKSISISKAANELLSCSGTQFDPKVVNKFLDMMLESTPTTRHESFDNQLIEHLLS